ncbi:MAG: hypothetical protein ACK53C_08070 [Pseudomonadota bacterium]
MPAPPRPAARSSATSWGGARRAGTRRRSSASWRSGRRRTASSPPTRTTALLSAYLAGLLRWPRVGYAQPLPPTVREVLEDFVAREAAGAAPEHRQVLIVQGVVAVLLLLGLALHAAGWA